MLWSLPVDIVTQDVADVSVKKQKQIIIYVDSEHFCINNFVTSQKCQFSLIMLKAGDDQVHYCLHLYLYLFCRLKEWVSLKQEVGSAWSGTGQGCKKLKKHALNWYGLIRSCYIYCQLENYSQKGIRIELHINIFYLIKLKSSTK